MRLYFGQLQQYRLKEVVVLRSEMNKIFFNKRQILCLYTFSRNQINFSIKNIFQFVTKRNKLYPNSSIKINQYIDVAKFGIISPGIGTK